MKGLLTVLVFLCLVVSVAAQEKPQYRLLRFTANWCPGCQTLKAEMQRTGNAALRANGVEEIIVDADTQKDAFRAWKVTRIPTIVLVELAPGGKAKIIRRHGDGQEMLRGDALRRFMDPRPR